MRLAFERYFLLAVSFQAVLAITQMAAIIPGVSSSWLVSTIHEWDISSKMNLNSEAIVAARATGAYLNPNTLGFSAMTSFWASALFLRGFAQKYALAASLLTLVLSVSRGSIVAVVISGMIFILLQALNRRNGSLRGQSKTVLLALAVAAIIGVLQLALWMRATLWASMIGFPQLQESFSTAQMTGVTTMRVRR